MGTIVSKQDFLNIKNVLKKEGKTFVLCHGVFDLVHPGHIIHFQEAKSLGDVLVVSVTAEKYVRKGPGRPYFNDEMRLKFLASIECIDYVILSEAYTVDDIIEVVEPDLYVKGQEYAKAEDDITGMIGREIDLVRQHGGDVYYTSGEVFSSTKLINTALPAMTDEVKDYMRDFKSCYTMQDIKDYTQQLDKLKVLVIGDVIIDEYVSCAVQGLMSKDMAYSVRRLRSERYLGGSMAVARHISTFVKHIDLMSIIGNEKGIVQEIQEQLPDNVGLIMEQSPVYPTIVKKRYITENPKRNEVDKVFVENNIPNPMKIDADSMQLFQQQLSDTIGEYDVVVLCDFGHGLVDKDVMQIVQDKAKFVSLNCQTNSTNYGMNLITKYKKASTFAVDQKELKLAFPDYTLTEEEAIEKLSLYLGCNGWLTRGSLGAMAIVDGKLISCPAFTLHVKDTIGAGDAFFAIASIYASLNIPFEVTTFMGNIAGALATNIVGNKEAVEKVNVLKYANTLLNI